MNANEIWSGNDYAHTEYISRGVSYYERANRVRALRVYKEQPAKYSYKERATTMVEVLMLDAITGEPLTRFGEEWIRNVRARDIFMRWDEYQREKERRDTHRERIAQEEAEKRAVEEQRKAAILDALEAKLNGGFNRLFITNITDYQIVLNRRQIEEWLGISNG